LGTGLGTQDAAEHTRQRESIVTEHALEASSDCLCPAPCVRKNCHKGRARAQWQLAAERTWTCGDQTRTGAQGLTPHVESGAGAENCSSVGRQRRVAFARARRCCLAQQDSTFENGRGGGGALVGRAKGNWPGEGRRKLQAGKIKPQEHEKLQRVRKGLKHTGKRPGPASGSR